MRAWSWAFVAAMGWGAMLAAFATRVRPDSRSPWGHGVVVVGPELPAELAQTGHATRVRLRNLPAIERTEAILRMLSQVDKDKAADLELGLRPRLFLLPLDKAGIDASSLQSGSMPVPGRDQVIAGASAAHNDRVTAGDRDARCSRCAQARVRPRSERLFDSPVRESDDLVPGWRSVGASGDSRATDVGGGPRFRRSFRNSRRACEPPNTSC